MAYSFDGATFHVATPDGMVPRFSRVVAHSIEHIPYSDKDVVDIGGMGSPIVRCPVILTSAEYAAFEAKIGLTGSLVYGVITVQATLTELTNARMNWDQNRYFFDATFVQVT